MKKPLKTADNAWDWYEQTPDATGTTFDGPQRLTDHWLLPATFDRLQGGELHQRLGVRRYSSREGAEAALHAAERKS